MRIESYTQVQQIYQSQTVLKNQKAANATAKKDELSISPFAKELQIAKNAVNGTPDVRQDLVASLKARIQDGTYAVSNEEFASKLMHQYAEVR